MSSIIEQNAANSQNPANAPQTRVTEATRIPMSLPELKLAVVDIPGYHLHWFRGARVPRALQAGYEYVDSSEVSIQRTGLAVGIGIDAKPINIVFGLAAKFGIINMAEHGLARGGDKHVFAYRKFGKKA